MNHKPNRICEFGPFRLDATERVLLRSGRHVALKPKSFDLLLALVENAGHILGKEELMDQVWPGSFVEEGNLTVGISNLRRILGRRRNGLPYIETVPRRGYRFIACVKKNWNSDRPQISSPLSVSDESIKKADLKGIAVLPFKTIGAEPIDEYLGLGLADALITKLSNIQQIVVRPTTAVRKYAGADDPVIAGRELNVTAVLDGSIQKAEQDIRVTVQLIDVRDGASLWAEKYDEQFINIFALEDSISEQVARALTLKLTAQERKLLSKRYTENTEAYLAYLKGRYFMGRRRQEDIKKAIECFEQAITVDQQYAPAYSGLADSYNLLNSYYRGYMTKAKKAVLKALELDDTLAEAHVSLAHIKMKLEWDWPGAESEFKRAIELNPNYAAAHHWYATTLRVMGRFDESLAQSRLAQELDPLSLIVNTSIGSSYYFRREYDKAIKQLLATIELDPYFAHAHLCLGLAFEGKQMYEEAIAEYQKTGGLIGKIMDVVAYLGHAYAMSGRTREARAMLAELEKLSQTDSAKGYFFALVYTALGDKEEAFKYLKLAYEHRNEDMALVNIDPMMDSLRDDPRFVSLVKSLGLQPARAV